MDRKHIATIEQEELKDSWRRAASRGDRFFGAIAGGTIRSAAGWIWEFALSPLVGSSRSTYPSNETRIGRTAIRQHRPKVVSEHVKT